MTHENMRYEVTRMSLEQAQEYYRDQDGLEPGAVVIAKPAVLRNTAEMQAIASVGLYEDLMELAFDAESPVVEDYDLIDIQHEGQSELQDISRVLMDRQLLQTTNAEADDEPRRIALKEIIHDFLNESGYAPADLGEQATIGSVLAFTSYYHGRLEQLIAREDLMATVAEARAELVGLVRLPAGIRLLGSDIVSRIVPMIRDIPIELNGPLEALANNNMEIMGSYDGSTCMVDPFTIAHVIGADRDGRPINDEVKKTLFHELLHAPSAQWFARERSTTPNDSDDEKYIGVKAVHIWPQFYIEAMTEKLTAYFFARASHATTVDDTVAQGSEERWRSEYTDNPHQVLTTAESRRVNRGRVFTYISDRTVVDTLFARLDWKAAGLTLKQAETLAARALFDLPSDTSRQGDNCQYLRAYNQALTKAGHQGIMWRISTLISSAGAGSVLDMLESPEFDPHDRRSLPMISGSRFMQWLAKFPKNYEFYMEHYLRLKANGYATPDMLTDAYDRYERAIAADEAYQIVRRGLCAALELRYGKRARSRQSMSPEERMLYAIFDTKLLTPVKRLGPEDARYAPLSAAVTEYETWFQTAKPALLEYSRNKNK